MDQVKFVEYSLILTVYTTSNFIKLYSTDFTWSIFEYFVSHDNANGNVQSGLLRH